MVKKKSALLKTFLPLDEFEHFEYLAKEINDVVAGLILSFRGRTMSILLTKLSETESSSPALCGTDGDLGSACFSSGGYGIYVISDTSDNLLVANSIFESLGRHISKFRASI